MKRGREIRGQKEDRRQKGKERKMENEEQLR